ncbi:helicase RepA family protein [Mesorhizobium marinum]|uniref:helicase RepA family protein n=1 Tax=Mesorhizobium marinum TaxID=3228790 RepID=UPI003465E31D
MAEPLQWNASPRSGADEARKGPDMLATNVADPTSTPLICSASEASNLLDSAEQAGLIRSEDHAALDTLRVKVALNAMSDADARATMHDLLAAGPAAEMALDEISSLFMPGDVVELRALHPTERAPASINGRLDFEHERASMVRFVRDHIGTRNLYFGANPRRTDLAATTRPADAADVASRGNIVVDLDFVHAPENDKFWTRTLNQLRELGPAMVVRSGNGLHIWLPCEVLDGAAVSASAGPLATAMTRLGADNMADPARIARLPFTVNLPTQSKRNRGMVPQLAVSEPGPTTDAARRTVDDICADLHDIANRLGLPGKKPAGTGAATVAAANDDKKTGRPAPSLDLLRMALERIPNQPGGHFDDRNEWQAFGHAVRGAAVAGGIEAEGRAAWLDWCAQWGGDPQADERFWDTCNRPHTGWGTIMRTLERLNPAGRVEVKAAEARAAFAQHAAINRAQVSSFALAPVAAFSPQQIPPRQWLYGRTVVAGFLSFLVAPGGAGKSALMMVEAVAMATGRELLKGEKPVRPLRVWYHNAEDDRDEMHRRLAGVLLHFGMTHADLNGNLILSSGRDMSVTLARQAANGPEILPGVVDGIVDQAKALDVDVIVLDPLGAMHTLPENSNEAANLLSGALRKIAQRTGAAIVLLHHTSKQAATDMDAAGTAASRGASAFTDAARVVRQVVRMTTKEAARFAIAEDKRRDYLRVENGKANLSRAESGRWLRMQEVSLGNGSGHWPLGDNVGVVERWTPPAPVAGTTSDLASVQAAIAGAPVLPRLDQRSPDWIGHLVARTLRLDIGPPGLVATTRTPAQTEANAHIRAMIEGWFRNGGLIRVDKRDPKSRRTVAFVGIGLPALMSAASDATDPKNNREHNFVGQMPVQSPAGA